MQKFLYVKQGIFVTITQQFLNQCRTVYAGSTEQIGGWLASMVIIDPSKDV
jgi:hypothetical protein